MPYGKIPSSFVLCPSVFLSSFQLPLSNIAKMHTVLQVNRAGSGFHFVTNTFCDNFALELNTIGQWATYFINHAR